MPACQGRHAILVSFFGPVNDVQLVLFGTDVSLSPSGRERGDPADDSVEKRAFFEHDDPEAVRAHRLDAITLIYAKYGVSTSLFLTKAFCLKLRNCSQLCVK